MLSELTAALRALGRAKGHAIAVVLILALGLGSTTAIYSTVEERLFPKLFRAPDPDSLVYVHMADSRFPGRYYANHQQFVAYRQAGLKSLRGVTGMMPDRANLVVGENVVVTTGAIVTADHLGVLGVRPALGRAFLPEDESATGTRPVVIGHQIWSSLFASDPQALGREVRIGDETYVVVGVLPRLSPAGNISYFIPFRPQDYLLNQANARRMIWTIARLTPGSTRAEAEAELRALNVGSDFAVPTGDARPVPTVLPRYNDSIAQPTSPFGRRLLKDWALLGSVGLLYLIACANAAGLLLARALDRRRELAVRGALGGSRWRIVRPVLLEGLLLTLLGTLLSFTFAKWLFSFLVALAPAVTAPSEALELSPHSLRLLAGLGVLTGLLLAVVPLWQAARLDIHAFLKTGSQAGSAAAGGLMRGTFVVIQIALAVTLLVATGLMLRTCRQLLSLDLGFDPAGKVLVQIAVPLRDTSSPQARMERMRLIIEAVSAVPGVHSVSPTTGSVFFSNVGGRFRAPSSPDPSQLHLMTTTSVGEQYFATVGLPLLLGRDFGGVRASDAPVGIVSESLARQAFGDMNPIGQMLVWDKDNQVEIIGVVGNARIPRQEPRPMLYRPLAQSPGLTGMSSLLVRPKGEPSPAFAAELRRAVFQADPKLLVTSVQRLEDTIHDFSKDERGALIHLQALGGLALVLAAFGLFAMMNYNVAQRHGEFGVRFALGATDADIQRLVLGRGLRLVLFGLAAGGLLAWYLARVFSILLYETPVFEPVTNLAVALLLVTTALFACWLPVRRATRVDLARLLRAE